MKELWISQYVSNITPEQIKKFAKENQIELTDMETNMIERKIKEEWKTILYGDTTKIFQELKDNLGEKRTEKIMLLYKEYKEKYKNYL